MQMCLQLHLFSRTLAFASRPPGFSRIPPVLLPTSNIFFAERLAGATESDPCAWYFIQVPPPFSAAPISPLAPVDSWRPSTAHCWRRQATQHPRPPKPGSDKGTERCKLAQQRSRPRGALSSPTVLWRRAVACEANREIQEIGRRSSTAAERSGVPEMPVMFQKALGGEIGTATLDG